METAVERMEQVGSMVREGTGQDRGFIRVPGVYLVREGTLPTARTEMVAAEVPVFLICNGVYVNMITCTPLDLADFAYGYVVTNGLAASARDITSVGLVRCEDGVEAHIGLAGEKRLPDRFYRLSPLSGRPYREGDRFDIDRVATRVSQGNVAGAGTPHISPSAIWKAGSALLAEQGVHRATGATHAAAFADPSGRLVFVREDVGRHNAVDKLVGAVARAGVGPEEGFVYLSSRCALELVAKCASYGIRCIATVSAPTSAVLRFGERAGITLCAFARDRRFTVYTHPERILD